MERKYDEIERMMLSMRDEGQVAVLSGFFKTGPGQYGEGDMFLGIKVPRTREVVKAVWRDCTFDDVEKLVTSPYHEMRLCGLLILVKFFVHSRKYPEMQERVVDFYLSHTEYINNWDLVDLSCYEILGRWLMDRDRSLLYELARHDGNLWEQRIAIVSCMAFVRAGETEDCLAIADLLLHHEHDLIHKAVGWLLREVGNRDGMLLREFLSGRYRTMPRTMLRYAIEKFPEEERRKYLKGEI